MNKKNLKDDLKKLQVKDGDLVVYTAVKKPNEFDMQFLQDMMQEVCHNIESILVILPPGANLECVPEAKMNEIGWYRKKEKK